MTFKEAVVKCLKGTRDYMSRARRSEFWYFLLFDSVATSIVNILTASPDSADGTSLWGSLVSILLLLPLLSVGSRRMHDIGKDGKFTFLQLIPLANFYFLYLCTKDSDPNPNQYGPCPKSQSTQNPAFFGNEIFSEKENSRPNAVNISDHVKPNTEKDEIQMCVEQQNNKPKNRFCANCGAALGENDNFCNNCGTKVER